MKNNDLGVGTDIKWKCLKCKATIHVKVFQNTGAGISTELQNKIMNLAHNANGKMMKIHGKNCKFCEGEIQA